VNKRLPPLTMLAFAPSRAHVTTVPRHATPPSLCFARSVQPATLARRRCCRRAAATRTAACASPLIPSTYEELYSRAARAATAAVAAGLPAVELEFPSTPSLSRAGTGSRAADDAARASNARLAAAVAREVGATAAVVVVVFDAAMRRAVRVELGNGDGLKVHLWGEFGEADLAVGSVLVAASPGAEEEWAWLERRSRSGGVACVVCNGLFSNGLDWLDPVFFMKPCTGWGVVMLEFPDRQFRAVSGRTGNVLQEVRVLKQGRIRRPDLQTASAVLMKDFYAKS
jgi:hypothetical protein